MQENDEWITVVVTNDAATKVQDDSIVGDRSYIVSLYADHKQIDIPICAGSPKDAMEHALLEVNYDTCNFVKVVNVNDDRFVTFYRR